LAATLNGKRNFFVRFNKADRAWAEWTAWVLEEASYSVWFQDWDFRGNFVEHMHRAHRAADRTLAVLSDHYFGSDFTLAEWSARITEDPAARDDRLVPVKVGHLTDGGILKPLIYADLIGCDETEAQQRLLGRVRKAVDASYRAKPSNRPGFPGGAAPRVVPEKPSFPPAKAEQTSHDRKRGPVTATAHPAESLPPCSPADWPRSNPRPFLDLAALELFTPLPADNLGERHNLHGRLQLGPYEPDAETEQIVLGLREALLAVDVAGGLAIDGSLIGVRAEHENLKPTTGGLIVTGPVNQNGHLEGEVLGGHHIASMAVTEPTQEASITVTLAAKRRGFDVRAVGADGTVLPTPAPSEAKDAILNRIIEQAIGQDHGHRPILQKQCIRRRRPT
jgi:hypothetical protein